MEKVHQDMMCVLLRGLLDQELITQDIHDKAREKILSTLGGADFFCSCEEKREGDANGHTQNSC